MYVLEHYGLAYTSACKIKEASRSCLNYIRLSDENIPHALLTMFGEDIVLKGYFKISMSLLVKKYADIKLYYTKDQY